MNEKEKLVIRSLAEDLEMPTEQYGDAPECANTKRESVIETLLQELERRMESLGTQVSSLKKQFDLILMDKSASTGMNESPNEKLPAYSPLAKRLEALIERHKEIEIRLDGIARDSEV